MSTLRSFFSESALARRAVVFALSSAALVAAVLWLAPWAAWWIIPGGVLLMGSALGLTLPTPRCGACRAFDLEAGQDYLARFPAFPRHFLSPDQMSRAGDPSAPDDGSGFPAAEPPEATAQILDGRLHTWEQYGICAAHRELRNCWDSCPRFRRR